MTAVIFNDTGYNIASIFLDPMLILTALFPLFIALTIYYQIAKRTIKIKYKLNVIKGIMTIFIVFYLHMLSLSYAPDSLLAKTGEVFVELLYTLF